MPTHTIAHDLQLNRIFPESYSVNDNRTPVQEFYSGKCILMTGATGFIGKVLIERLLSMYPDINTIYILIRNKKGKDIKTRLADLFKCPIYSKLSENWRKKIVAIEGELGEENLALKQEDRSMLIDRVNIVFHCAATVKFDEKLNTAIKINVIGTKDVVALCKKMKNLEAMLHVSTAFAHCDKSLHIEEKFYDPGLYIDEASCISNCYNESILDVITPKLLNNFGNTYAYTKSAAEHILKTESKNIPAAIFRPGIIIGATDKYPYTGFLDNFYGPSGIVLGCGMGVLRTMQNNDESPSHMIPVDYCVNVMLAAAWDVAQHNHESMPIYNYTPPLSDNINWKTFVDYTTKWCSELPLSNGIWFPGIILTKYKITYNILFILLHIVPALLVDSVLRILGRKPILLGVQRKVSRICNLLEYYLKSNWTFQLDGVANLQSRLSPKDKESLYMDMTNFDWASYLYTFLLGLGIYVIKESPDNLDRNRKRMKKLQYLHYFTIVVLAAIGIYFSWSMLKHFVL